MADGRCVVRRDADSLTIGNGLVARTLSLAGGRVRTAGLWNGLAGRAITTGSRGECAVVLGTARWRHDIPFWRWRRGSRTAVAPGEEEGYRAGYQRPDLDDAEWSACPHSHPVLDAVYDGYAWFRHRFALPADLAGEPIVLCVGGLDNEDWLEARFFLNGQPVAEQRGGGRWREPPLHWLRPGERGYAALRFGEENLLAVQARGLDRRLPGMIEAELEHYFFRSPLVDQFLAAGEPCARVEEFALLGWEQGGDDQAAILTIHTHAPAHALEATLRYEVRAGEPLLRKRVELRNQGEADLLVLDLEVEDWEIAAAVAEGGQGVPLYLDGDAFCGLEHPMGLNQGEAGRVRLRHFPGRRLAPGERLAGQPAIFGAAPAGGVHAAFHRYLAGIARRQPRLVSIYSALGLYDYTNPADPLFSLTEELVIENLETLARLRQQGISFEYYMLDDWQDYRDLLRFRPSTFPDGPGRVRQRIEELGMRPGLWFATTMAQWTCGEDPRVEPCVVPGTGMSREAWWLDEWASWLWTLRQLCPAAEPYRTILREALIHQARALNAGCIKLDCAVLFCNDVSHGHLAGRYSAEALADAMLDTVRALHAAVPGLFLIWYWGYASPWWLPLGDLQFDKKLRLEAASPASSPMPSYRQGVSLNLDQALHFARFVPPLMQDSLGVWLGDVAWANRMGKEGWRDALVLDLGRGGMALQIWGDLESLDADDERFLAEICAWLRQRAPLLAHTATVGGDPWRAEPYGYAHCRGGEGVVVLHNPRFEAAAVHLVLSPAIGLDAAMGPFELRVLYPERGLLAPAGRHAHAPGEEVAVPLRPFEVMLLEIGAASAASPSLPLFQPRPVRPGQRIPLALEAVAEHRLAAPPRAALDPRARDYQRQILAGAIVLPPQLGRYLELAISVRLARNGVYWYHPDVPSLLSLRGELRGHEVYSTVVPRTRSWNGPGTAWALYRLPAGPAWSGERLDLALAALLPPGIELEVDAWLYERWRRER